MNTHDGTRTHNLTLRRGAPCPLGHAGSFGIDICTAGRQTIAILYNLRGPRNHVKNRDPYQGFSKKIGGQCLVVGTHDGTRTHNLTLRRGAPYPLGHAGSSMSLHARSRVHIVDNAGRDGGRVACRREKVLLEEVGVVEGKERWIPETVSGVSVGIKMETEGGRKERSLLREIQTLIER
eukprot:762994-Hanusia_phi.AAC.6